MNPSNTVDFQTIATWLGWLLMGLLSFMGVRLWNDVRDMKERWITRDEFNRALADSNAQFNKGLADSNAERDKKHLENTGNFRRIEEKIDRSDERQNDNAIAIEQRLGDVLVKIAEIRPPSQRSDGPDRRRY